MRPLADRLSPVIRAFVIVDALLLAFYALVKPARSFVEQHLALGPSLLSGEIWQLATSLFVHVEPLGFFFNILGLWFVGAAVEREFGTRRFLALFLVPGVAANATMGFLQASLGRPDFFTGCGQSVLALFVAFAVAYGRAPARILGSLVIEARTLSLIIVGFALLADIANGIWSALAGTLVAVGLGYLLAGGRGDGLRDLLHGLRARRARRRYQIIEGGRSGRPPYLN